MSNEQHNKDITDPWQLYKTVSGKSHTEKTLRITRFSKKEVKVYKQVKTEVGDILKETAD